MLRTEPSFSIYNSEDGFGEESENGCSPLERSVTIGDSIGSGEFSFGKKGIGLIEEDDNEKEQDGDEEETLNGFKNLGIEEIVRPVSPPMYLATGFGMDGNGVGGGGGGFGVDFRLPCFDEGGDVEDYYKMMVSEDPSNPLFLRNYAKLLQSKGDLSGAEEFYFCATLADPKDGEILLQYAKLVWELHRDQDRALSYFECAARAAPEDSHVLAAYASFLWEIDDDKQEDFVACTDHIQIEDEILIELQNSPYEERPVSPPLHLAVAAGLGIDVASVGGNTGNIDYTATNPGEGVNVEEYYKRMVEENSCNPLFLRNYAQFLYQSKGDPEGAEEYYSRAILADPEDSEIISQYANLVWELYHDHDKALCYFERAVQAAPGDSHILAAYARFLWETEDEDEHSKSQDDIQLPVFQVAMTPANA